MSMMMVSSIFCMLAGEEQNGAKKKEEIWNYLKEKDPDTYRKLRKNALGIALNTQSKLGCEFDILVYRLMNKIYKFN